MVAARSLQEVRPRELVAVVAALALAAPSVSAREEPEEREASQKAAERPDAAAAPPAAQQASGAQRMVLASASRPTMERQATADGVEKPVVARPEATHLESLRVARTEAVWPVLEGPVAQRAAPEMQETAQTPKAQALPAQPQVAEVGESGPRASVELAAARRAAARSRASGRSRSSAARWQRQPLPSSA